MSEHASEIGTLLVVTGPTRSGKTSYLIKQAVYSRIGQQDVVILGPTTGGEDLVALYGSRVDVPVVLLRPGAETIPGVIAAISDLGEDGEAALTRAKVVYIDNAHLCSDPRHLCEQLMLEGKKVVVAGVNLTFAGQGFGPMPDLLAQADEILLLKAVCHYCGADATRSMCLLNDKPVPLRESLGYKSDGHITREPICLACFAKTYGGKLSL